jgi:hypothetical protein
MARANTGGSGLELRNVAKRIRRERERIRGWLRRERGSFARFERRVEELARELRESPPHQAS